MKPSVLLSWLAVFPVLAACESGDGGGPTDVSGGPDVTLPADTAAPSDTPEDGAPPGPCATCPAACAADDDCDPGRRCLADECGCVTCVGHALPFSGPESCPDGWDTTQAPPIPPRVFGLSACVPPLCDGAACYGDFDCADGAQCAGDDVWRALQGRCLPSAAPPGCYDAEDCPPGATCVGATSCPACRTCEDPAATAGRCVADAGAGPVFLFVREEDWGWFSPGPIPAWWVNLGAEPIDVPGCESYAVEHGHWDGPTESWTAAAAEPACEGGEVVVPLAPGAWLPVAGLEVLCSCNPDGAIHVRLRGRYGLGCQEGVPFADAGCTSGPLEVTSADFWVGWPY